MKNSVVNSNCDRGHWQTLAVVCHYHSIILSFAAGTILRQK